MDPSQGVSLYVYIGLIPSRFLYSPTTETLRPRRDTPYFLLYLFLLTTLFSPLLWVFVITLLFLDLPCSFLYPSFSMFTDTHYPSSLHRCRRTYSLSLHSLPRVRTPSTYYTFSSILFLSFLHNWCPSALNISIWPLPPFRYYSPTLTTSPSFSHWSYPTPPPPRATTTFYYPEPDRSTLTFDQSTCPGERVFPG